MKLSIIVVTWNNENFIEQALKSCIEPDIEDYEVIVVHNASNDRTGSLIRRATRGFECLFQIVENEKNEGLGEARNIGLRHARGKYIAFLDGDDWFANGSVSRIVEIVDKTESELVIFNHCRTWDNGTTRQNAKSYLLKEGFASDPARRKALLANFGVAWNKVYRRELIDRNNMRFNRRLYEDVDWNFIALTSSKSIYTIPDTLINYRQRSGSITKSASERHFDILDQYRDVLAMLEKHPDRMQNYGDAIYRYARAQIFTVVDARHRLPHRLVGKYLKEAHHLLKQWRSSLGIERLDRRLMVCRLGSPNLYFALLSAHSVLKPLRKHTRRFQPRKLAKWVRLLIYRRVFLLLPVRNNRVYCESFWGAKIDCNPRAIADGLLANGAFEVAFGLKNTAHETPYQTIKIGSLKYYAYLATAKYVVSNTNIAGDIVKRKGTKHVQTWHGTPWKTMGLDIKPYNPKEMNWSAFARRSRRWDYVLSSNPYSSAVWRRSCPYEYKMLETGYPRNDVLFHSKPETVASIKASFQIPPSKKVALYAPTFREHTRNSRLELDASPFDFDKAAKALGDEYVLLVRSHYFNSGTNSISSVIDASHHANTNELLLAVDLLITDYSSIMFDFACLGRPILLYAYDYQEYRSTRGSYFDLRDIPPGHISFDMEDLEIALKHRIFASHENNLRLKAFQEEFCPWDDGHATDRVLNEVFKLGPKQIQ